MDVKVVGSPSFDLNPEITFMLFLFYYVIKNIIVASKLYGVNATIKISMFVLYVKNKCCFSFDMLISLLHLYWLVRLTSMRCMKKYFKTFKVFLSTTLDATLLKGFSRADNVRFKRFLWKRL